MVHASRAAVEYRTQVVYRMGRRQGSLSTAASIRQIVRTGIRLQRDRSGLDASSAKTVLAAGLEDWYLRDRARAAKLEALAFPDRSVSLGPTPDFGRLA
ncbi:MAG TPA: hypothetical protein VEI97_18430, partial [bacterium]|nr:hypothetical protein [bacterium]